MLSHYLPMTINYPWFPHTHVNSRSIYFFCHVHSLVEKLLCKILAHKCWWITTPKVILFLIFSFIFQCSFIYKLYPTTSLYHCFLKKNISLNFSMWYCNMLRCFYAFFFSNYKIVQILFQEKIQIQIRKRVTPK